MNFPVVPIAPQRVRDLSVIAIFLFTLLAGIGCVYINYLRELRELSFQAAKLGAGRIENVLKYAHAANAKVSPLIGLSCDEAWSALRKEATQTSFVRTINLAQNDIIYCSSFFGQVRIDAPSRDFFIGKIRLLPGNLLRPDHPVLSIRDVAHRGSVITNIDSSYLALMMSMELNGGRALLSVGGNWLDEQGRFYSKAPPLPALGLAKYTSARYPLTIYIGYPYEMGQWQNWIPKNRGLLRLVLVCSLMFTLLTWCWLRRTSPPAKVLARAIKGREFIPYLQPVVDASTRQLCGVEVLMRWKHPTAGMIEPAAFIPQAEASGLIVQMTRQLMQCVAQALAPLQALLPVRFHIAFNISSAHFTSMKLVEDCQEFLAQFAPGRVILTLELTERELLLNDGQTQKVFNYLGAMGVQFALDDFGTGHASLAYLKQFHIDILKLDQSFVRRIGCETLSQHIVDNVIDLGGKLGLVVVAEGVETPHQADYLRDKGVDQLQGYLFGYPLPMGDFVEILRASESS